MSQIANPLVSVLCRTYNHELFIEDAIKGFISQNTDFPIEVIIHDDASTDSTAAIVNKYQQQYPDLIKPIFQKENQFSREKRKVAKILFNAAKGKYFAYCDGDDYWTDPFKLQKQVDFLESNPDFAVIHSDFEEKFEKNSGSRRGLHGTIKPKSGNVFFDLLRANFIGTLTAMVRADIIRNLDGVYEKNYVYDYWLWLKIAENHKLKYLNQATAVYRIHGDSLTAKKVFINVRIFYVMKDAIFSYLKNNPYNTLRAKEKDIIIWSIFRIIKSKGMSFLDKRSSIMFIINHPARINRLFKIGLSKLFLTFNEKNKQQVVLK